MAKLSAFDALQAQYKRRRSIQRPIAADVWTFIDTSAGTTRRSELTIGKPRRIPGDDGWYREVRVSGWMSHVMAAVGTGPFDALDNAMKVVRGFQEYVGDMHINRQSDSSWHATNGAGSTRVAADAPARKKARKANKRKPTRKKGR